MIGELENALFEDCDESSSLSVSDSDDFSGSSSSSVTVDSSSLIGTAAASSFLIVASGVFELETDSFASAVDSRFGSCFGMRCFGTSVMEDDELGPPSAAPAVVVVVVVVSEAGEPGDFSSLKPFSSERI